METPVWVWEGHDIPLSAFANAAARLFSVFRLNCFALICAFDVTAALQGGERPCLAYTGEKATRGKILMATGGYAGAQAAAALKRACRGGTGQLRGPSAMAGVLGGLQEQACYW